MSYSQSKQVSHMASLYESIYAESLNEEKQNQLLMVEWYNAMIKEGLIKGSLIENGIINENMNLFAKIGQAITNQGPKVLPVLRNIIGFGLGPGVGGKRKALTIGAGTATAIDPQKAANQVSGAATGTATAINRAGRAAMGQAVPAAQQGQPPVGTPGQSPTVPAGMKIIKGPDGKNKVVPVQQSFDLFDVVKGHLLDEGYADTEEAALVIMANMSEEWRESILSEDPVQDYVVSPLPRLPAWRDMKRADENRGGARGPELSHNTTPGLKGKPQPGRGSVTQKPTVRGREFTNPPS